MKTHIPNPLISIPLPGGRLKFGFKEPVQEERIKPYYTILNGSYKQGTINASYAKIVEVLGFEPNGAVTEDKVKYDWVFTIDGEPAAIWDWKGSADQNQFSYFNPKVAELFK